MATGLVEGAIVSQLLTSLIDAVRTFNDSKQRLRGLQERLLRLRLLVETLDKNKSVDTQAAEKWLGDLLKVLQDARTLVSKSQNHVKRMLHAGDLDNVNKKISEILEDAVAIQLQQLLELRQQLTSQLTEDITFASASASSYVRDAKIRRVVGHLQKTHDTIGDEASSSVPAPWKSHWNTACNVPKLPQNLFGGEAVANQQIEDILRGEYRKWIVMWGMGGVGKTCTALRLYHNPSIQKHFTGGMYWVTVSKDQAPPLQIVKQLYQEIKKKLHIEDSDDKAKRNRERNEERQIFSQLGTAQKKVKDLLMRDKVLLVLDDVWEPQILQALDVISAGRKGVILTTTRDKGILKFETRDEITQEDEHLIRIADRAKVVEIPRLSEEHSWQLFSWHAFDAYGEPVPEELRDVAEAVAKECKGLPLALKVIGSTMGATHLSVEDVRLGRTLKGEWQKALEQLRQVKLEGMWRKMIEEHQRGSQYVNEDASLYGRLQWSLDSLAEDPRLMKCYNYFAAYSEDFDIPVENLFRMWGAEGLCGEEEAVELLGTLLAKSVVELAVDGRTCKIHDVLRDILRLSLKFNLKAGRRVPAPERRSLYEPGLDLRQFPEDWIDHDVQLSATRLSLQDNSLDKLPKELHAPDLQVLMLGENSRLTRLPARFFHNLSMLKVLNLSRTGIKKIPGSVFQHLKSLVLLDLTDCYQLEKVSNKLRTLEHLEILLLSGCSLRFPRMKGLSKLHTLTIQLRDGLQSESPVVNMAYIFIRFCQPRLQEVFQLRSLRRLDICGEQWDSRTVGENLPRILSLSALEELSLRWVPRLPVGLEGLQCLKVLELVKVHTLIMPPLNELPLLEVLRIQDCKIDLPNSFGRHGAFPSLRKLMIHNVRSKTLFQFRDGTMPKIETLHLWVIPDSEAFWVSGKLEVPLSIAHLPTLKFLHLFQPRLEVAGMDALFNEPFCFPSLERLVFSSGSEVPNMPSHILERERPEKLKVETVDFDSLLLKRKVQTWRAPRKTIASKYGIFSL